MFFCEFFEDFKNTFFCRTSPDDCFSYTPQCGLDDSQKDNFYESFINVVRKLGEKGIVVIGGYLNGHLGSNL